MLADKGILLVEDVCEAHGAFHTDCQGRKKRCGTIGFVSNFSFYYAHHMSTIEGGMICTNDDRFYEYMRMFRSHGMLREAEALEFREKWMREYPECREEFLFAVPGFNMRSTELNAVIGISQLKRLEDNIEKRRRNYRIFMEHLDGERFYTDFMHSGNSSYAFVVLLRKKDPVLFHRLTAVLASQGVEYRRGTAGGGNQARQPYVRKYLPHLL